MWAEAEPARKPTPHARQKRARDVRGAPQFGQNFGTAAPHAGQNQVSAVSPLPHDPHVELDPWVITHLH